MRTLLLLVLSLAAALGAYAQKGITGPCALLTKAEVTEATGTAVAEGAINANNKLVCDYKASSGAINVLLTDKGPADSAEKVAAELNKRKMAAQVVPGIGDGAYTSSPGYGMQQIGVFKGARHFVVTVMLFGAPEAKSKAAAEKLARKAVTKL